MESSERYIDELQFAKAVDEFTDRCHRGEPISVEEFASHHPELKSVLLQVLPAIQALAYRPQQSRGDFSTPRSLSRESTQRQAGDACGPEASLDVPTPWPQIGGYEILGEIGAGGMGAVFQARHLQLDRIVAIKVLRESSAIAAVSERLRTEARSLAKIHHPHIVQIFELGEYQGQPFLALEYCAGGSLAERIAGEPQPPHWSAAVILKLADALQAAHAAGLLHRDLKPANVLLTADDIPKIADFGLVRQVDTDQGRTQTGAILGTPSYMAPEQTQGDRDRITTAADIYALGATLYEMLVGRPPFKGLNFFETLEQVRHAEPVPPRQLQPSIPEDLERICLRCLRKDPAGRYATATDLAEDLRCFLQSRPLSVPPPPVTDRARRWHRRRILVTLLTVVVLFVAGGLTGWRVLSRQARAKSPATINNVTGPGSATVQVERQEQPGGQSPILEPAHTAGDQAPITLKKVAKRLADAGEVESQLTHVRVDRQSSRAGRRFNSLNSLAAVAATISAFNLGEDLRRAARNEMIACLGLFDLRIDRYWAEPDADHYHVRVRFDRNLERYANLEPNGRLVVRRMADNALLHEFPGLDSTVEKRPFSVFSPDGRYLAIKGGPQTGKLEVRLWDLSDGKELLASQAGGTWERHWHDRALTFTPDSRQLVYVGSDGSLRFFDITQQQEVARLPMPEIPYTLSFRPDGKKIAAIWNSAAGKVYIVNVADGSIEQILGHPSSVHATDWTPDGQQLAVGCGNKNVYLWDVATEKILHTCRGHHDKAIHVAFNRRGDVLMSSGWDRTTRFWDPHTGRHLLATDLRGIEFSHDDRRLAFNMTGVATGRWEFVTPRECQVLVAPRTTQPIISLSFSPDGTALASACRLGDGYRIWSVHDGQLLASIPHTSPDGCAAVVFEPDGRSLITSDTEIRRWPCSSTADGWQLGTAEGLTPTELPPGSAPWKISLDEAGQRLVTANHGQPAVVWNLATRKPIIEIDMGPNARFAELSPDGEWVAVSSSSGTAVDVWSVSERQIATTVPVSASRVTFSPDSSHMAICTSDEVIVRSVGSWNDEAAWQKDVDGFSSVAFSPDKRLLAIVRNKDVWLIDTATGDEIATLTPPRDAPLLSGRMEECPGIVFSRDGTQLAVGSQQGYVFLWDLHLIREQLAEIDLDWSHPPLTVRR